MASGKISRKKRRKNQAQDQQAARFFIPAGSGVDRESCIYTLLVVFLIAVFSIILYAQILQGPFVFDDVVNIAENPHIRMTALTPGQVAQIRNGPSASRPVAMLTFALNYYVHQYRVAGYHAVNILIHIITALLVFLVTGKTLALCRVKAVFLPSLLSTLIWLAHPLHTQSVTYVVQRMNSMAAMFYLLALFCYINARILSSDQAGVTVKKGLLLGAAILSGGFGLASKPTAATLPVILFFYEWFFFQDMKAAWLKKNLVKIVLPAITFIAIALLYLGTDPLKAICATYDMQNFSMAQRLLTEPLVVIYYLSLLVFPHPARLSLDYDFPLSHGLFTPSVTALGPLTLFMILALAIFMARKHRLVGFAIFWFLITLVIESSFIGLALIYEHRTYLPSVFPVMAFVTWISQLSNNRRIIMIALSIVIIMFGFWTDQRNDVWHNELLFWQDGVDKSPRRARPRNNLGLALFNAGKPLEAEKHYHRALALDPFYQKAHYNLGLSLFKREKPVEAEPYFRRALELDPSDQRSHNNLGETLFHLGKLSEAEKHYRRALELDSPDARVYNNLGNLLSQRGDSDQAIVHYQRALELMPSFAEAYNNLAIEYVYKGQPNQALACFQKALDLNPAYQSAAENLQRLRKTMNKHGGVFQRRQNDVANRPNDPMTQFALADLCQQLKMTEMARQHYEKALALAPDCSTCLDRLAKIYSSWGKYAEAVKCLQRLTELHPGNPGVAYSLARLYAHLGKEKATIESLKKAIKLGFNDRNRLVSDPFLQSIRNTEYFQALMLDEDPDGGGDTDIAAPAD